MIWSQYMHLMFCTKTHLQKRHDSHLWLRLWWYSNFLTCWCVQTFQQWIEVMSRLWVLLYSWGFEKWSTWSDHVDHFNVTFNLYNLSCIFIIFISCMKVKESKKFSGLMKFLASFVTVAIFCVILGFLSVWPFVFLFWIFFFAPLLKLKFLLFYDREQHALHVHTVQAYLQ